MLAGVGATYFRISKLLGILVFSNVMDEKL